MVPFIYFVTYHVLKIYIDEWMGGWMDGSELFCDVYFSKTSLYIIIIAFGPRRRRFKVSFDEKKKQKCKGPLWKYIKNAEDLMKYMLTGMSVCRIFTETSGFPGLLATFILTDG